MKTPLTALFAAFCAALLASLLVGACSSTPGTPNSGPIPDSGLPIPDGGDAGADAGPVDAGIDAGQDAGPSDAGIPDAGPSDAGEDDAGEPDGGSDSDAGGDTENNYNWSIDAGFFTAKAEVACLNLNDGEFGCYGEFKGYDGGCVSSSLFLTGAGAARAMTYTADQVCPCSQDLSIRFAFPATPATASSTTR